MNHAAEIQRLANRISETEKRVARQVERVFILRSAHLDCEEADAKLSELCSKLASHKARLVMAITAKGPRPDEKSLRAGADVGGPRWRIGWGMLH
jgi:hypothetical protein